MDYPKQISRSSASQTCMIPWNIELRYTVIYITFDTNVETHAASVPFKHLSWRGQ